MSAEAVYQLICEDRPRLITWIVVIAETLGTALRSALPPPDLQPLQELVLDLTSTGLSMTSTQ
jgi:hypothetical protein